jgi:GT2 family glycosyltransferase
MSKNPLVSLILVTYQSQALLPKFFAALGETAYTPYEIIVVDNASTDESLFYLAEHQPQAKILALATNEGFGRACNHGAKQAQGDLLVFLNPDLIVTPSWLTLLVQRSSATADCAILCPTTLYPSQLPTPPPPGKVVEEQAAVPGCALLIKREAWAELKGFDERIFLYWEDVDLCWRAWLKGWQVLTDLQAYVYHERGGSGGGERWEAERLKNGIYTYLKLLRWRKVLPFLLLQAAKTVIRFSLTRDKRLLWAWLWNFRHLGETFAQRREFTQKQRGNMRKLEALIATHDRRQRRERRERRNKSRKEF